MLRIDNLYLVAPLINGIHYSSKIWFYNNCWGYGTIEHFSYIYFPIYKEDDLNKTGIFIKGSKYVNVQPRRTLALFFFKMKGEMILIKKEAQILKTHDHRKIYKDIYQIKPGKTIIQQLPELKYVLQ